MSDKQKDGAAGFVPHNAKVERSVLAACWRGPEVLAEVMGAGVKLDSFYGRMERMLWEATVAAHEANLEVDELTVEDQCAALWPAAGEGPERSVILEVAECISSAAFVRSWVDVLLKLEKQRLAIRLAGELLEAVSVPVVDFKEIQAAVLPVLEGLAGLAHEERGLQLREVADRLIHDTVAVVEGRELEVDRSRQVWLPTPHLTEKLTALDPMQQDFLIVIGGESSHGKSALARQMCGVALSRGQRVVAFTLETGRRKFLDQLAGQRAYWDLRAELAVQRAEAKGEEKLAKYLENQRWLRELADEQLFVFEDVFALGEIQARCRAIKEKTGRVDLVLVDYLQEMEKPEGLREDQALGNLVRGLKRLGKWLECPVLCISSLNNEAPETGPSLRHLRGSGDIRFAGDRVWFVHRPKTDANGNEQGEDRKTVQVVIDQAKARDLWTGKVWTQFQKCYVNFTGLPPADKRGRKSHDPELEEGLGF